MWKNDVATLQDLCLFLHLHKLHGRSPHHNFSSRRLTNVLVHIHTSRLKKKKKNFKYIYILKKIKKLGEKWQVLYKPKIAHTSVSIRLTILRIG